MPNRKVHHVGTAMPDHHMPVSTLARVLSVVIQKHKATSGLPEPEIRFPHGFWLTYVDTDSEPVPLDA